MKSASATASPFVSPTQSSSSAVAAARSASREPTTTSSPDSCRRSASARPNGPVPPTTATRTRPPARSRRVASPTRVAHERLRDDEIDVGRRRRVRLVDDEGVDQARRNRQRRALVSAPPAMRVSIRPSGPVTAAPPTSGLTATQRTLGWPRSRPGSRRRRESARSRGTDCSARRGSPRPSAIASTTPGAALRRLGSLVVDGVDLVRVTTTDEPLLEREPPGGRRDVRPEPIVRRRQDPCRARLLAAVSRRGDLGQSVAAAQRLRADEVEPEVAVAEPEPVLSSPARRRLERVPGLVGSSPAALGVDEPAERVEQAVEVGRDVQAEDLDVVSDVADDGQLARLRGPREPTREACAAAAAREQDDLSRRNGEKRARARPEASAEALEIGVGVDVELELGDADGRERRMSTEAVGAARCRRAVRRRGIGQRERVRRSVARLDEREPGVRETAEEPSGVTAGRSALTTSA